jgi:hypothetical protein
VRRAGTLESTPAPFARGDEVLVTEEAIRPWAGVVTAVKWSNVSGWWIEIRTESYGTWSIPAAHVSALEPAEEVV